MDEQFLQALRKALRDQSDTLAMRDVKNPEIGKLYQFNLRANILNDLALVLRKLEVSLSGQA